MATLYFKVSSDWEQVVKLRQECEKLEAQLKKMDSRSAPAATKTLETQLASTKQQMMGLVTEAAKAGAEIENDFKKKIYDASQTVNGLSEKIIAQRAVIKDIEFDVKRLGDAYRTALKNNPIGASGKLAEYNAARKALDEEKAALFGLTQQQAEARLSVKKLRDEYSLYKKEAGDTVEINNGLSLSWGKMLGVIGGATALKSLASQIVRVRGEFQSMQTAIETMVGKDVASGLMAQLKEMAKISPLTLTDMVNAEKMMLGFNIQAEDTVRYLQALSDISMGDSVKFKSLTLAFSQMSAAGKLMGQDLNQMINAGFNPLQIISEKTGKSIATLKDEMSKGTVSAEMVQQAFIDATSAGGKFYQMSENASKTINGQLSMMQDALDAAFNEMGQASEGVIMDGIQLTTSLIQNYETVGKVLVGLVATYGTYRTAVMLATVATSKHTIAEVALTNARVIARKAQLLLNAAMLTNPYVAVATVVTALATSIWVLSTRTSEAEKATERFNAIMDEHNKKEEEHKQAVDALISTIQDQNKAEGERLAAFEKLKAEYPTIFQNYTTETEFLKEIVKYKRLIAEEDARRSTSSLEEQLRIEQNRLNHYRQVRASGTSTSLVDMDGNGWASDNVEDAIKAQTQIVNSLKAQISTPLVNSYLESIKTLKDEDIKSVLDEITLSMKALGDSGKDAIAIVASLGGEFSKEQLGMIKSALETEQKSRSERTSYAEDYEQARKDWEEAKKELQKIESDKDKFTSKQYEDAKKRVETTEKAYKNLGGDVKGKTVKYENSILTQQSRISELEEKQAQERIRQQIDLENQVEQAEIDALQDSAEKTERQRKLNNKKELQAIEQQKKDYIQSVIQAQKEIFDAQEELKAKQNPSYKKKSFDSSSISVDTSVFDAIYDFTRERQINDQIREQERAWNEYLIRYGTYQQKRKAIIEKYDKEIAESKTAGDMAIKTEEKKAALEQLDEQYGKSTRAMADLFEDASEKSVSSIQRIIDKYELLVKYLSGTKQSDNTAVTSDELKDAGFTDHDIEKIEKGEISIKGLTDALKGLKEELKGKSPWQSFISDMQKGIDKLKAADKDTQKIGEGVTIIGDAVTNFAPALGEFGNGIASIFGVEDSNITEITNAISGLGQTASGLGQIMSGDVAGGIMSMAGGAAKAVDAIGKLFGPDGTAYYEKVRGQLEAINSTYQKIIDNSKELVQFGGGFASIDAASLALDNYYKKVRNLQRIAEASTRYGADWNSHSAGWHSNKNVGAENFAAMGKIVDKTIDDIVDLTSLTGDELYLIMTQMPEAWSQIDEHIRTALEDIIECRDESDGLKDALSEAVTGISFDSFYNGFIENLSDMEMSAEDFADNFEEYLRKSILASVISNQYKGQIEKLYKDWEKAGKDQVFTEDEVNALRQSQQDLVNQLIEERENLKKTFGWDTEAQEQQSASSGGFETMTHDQASEVSGRFTAVAESNMRIEQATDQQTLAITQLSGSISVLTSQIYGSHNIAEDTRNILAQSYLELQQINENTGNSAKYLKDIKADIAIVKQNTSRI
jgi:tape measure domain-containing protein